MEAVKRSKNKIVPWDTHLDNKYGKPGTPSRTEFEIKVHAFIIGELLKDERARNDDFRCNKNDNLEFKTVQINYTFAPQ